MIDYKNIEKICRKNTALSAKVIDAFLMYYAAQQNKLEEEVNRELAKYKHITRNNLTSWVNSIRAQYIVHRVFKKDGLIKKYLQHSALKSLMPEERTFLEQHAKTPWRFCFSIIQSSPETDFYEMEDVFNEDTFLLFSPATTKILKEKPVSLWFNLIAFNGHCWQTFGPVCGYQSFEPDDIYFYATALTPSIENETDLIKHIEQHPVPFMMLFTGSELPGIFNGKDQYVLNQSSYDITNELILQSKEKFTIKNEGHIWQYGLKRWNEFPHFAQCYYDEQAQILLLTACTDRGFLRLLETLSSLQIPVDPFPDIRVNISMLNTVGKILQKKIILNPYEEFFVVKNTPGVQADMDNMNKMLEMILPAINSSNEPDYEKLSRDSGVEIETIRKLVERLRRKRQKA